MHQVRDCDIAARIFAKKKVQSNVKQYPCSKTKNVITLKILKIIIQPKISKITLSRYVEN